MFTDCWQNLQQTRQETFFSNNKRSLEKSKQNLSKIETDDPRSRDKGFQTIHQSWLFRSFTALTRKGKGTEPVPRSCPVFIETVELLKDKRVIRARN